MLQILMILPAQVQGRNSSGNRLNEIRLISYQLYQAYNFFLKNDIIIYLNQFKDE